MFVLALGVFVAGVACVPVAIATGTGLVALGLPVGIVLSVGIAVYALNHAD